MAYKKKILKNKSGPESMPAGDSWIFSGLTQPKESRSVPEQLALIPEDQKVRESLGWQPGTYGCLLMITAYFLPALATYKPGPLELAIYITTGVLGLGLVYYEFRRRKHRTILVKAGKSIAVFHGDRLDLSLEPDRIEFHPLSLITVIQLLVTLAAFATGFFFFAVLDKSLEPGYRLLNGMAGRALLASLASLVWTRFFCLALRLPGEKGKFFLETVLIRPRQKGKLF